MMSCAAEWMRPMSEMSTISLVTECLGLRLILVRSMRVVNGLMHGLKTRPCSLTSTDVMVGHGW